MLFPMLVCSARREESVGTRQAGGAAVSWWMWLLAWVVLATAAALALGAVAGTRRRRERRRQYEAHAAGLGPVLPEGDGIQPST
jgi:hypothetical protein